DPERGHAGAADAVADTLVVAGDERHADADRDDAGAADDQPAGAQPRAGLVGLGPTPRVLLGALPVRLGLGLRRRVGVGLRLRRVLGLLLPPLRLHLGLELLDVLLGLADLAAGGLELDVLLVVGEGLLVVALHAVGLADVEEERVGRERLVGGEELLHRLLVVAGGVCLLAEVEVLLGDLGVGLLSERGAAYEKDEQKGELAHGCASTPPRSATWRRG